MMPTLKVSRDLHPQETQHDGSIRLESPVTAQRGDLSLVQKIDDVDDKHDEAHERLRKDFNAFQSQMLNALETLRDRAESNANRLTKLENTPPDIEKIVLTPKILIAALGLAITISGGVWAASYSNKSDSSALQSDVRDILTRMELTSKLDERQRQLDTERNAAGLAALTALTKRVELTEIEVRNMSAKQGATK
jgi:hypothetical protein